MDQRDTSRLQRAIAANQRLFRLLEASKTLSEGINDELAVALLLLDPAGRILSINAAGREALDVTVGEALGRQVADLLTGGASEAVRGHLAKGPQERLA